MSVENITVTIDAAQVASAIHTHIAEIDKDQRVSEDKYIYDVAQQAVADLNLALHIAEHLELDERFTGIDGKFDTVFERLGDHIEVDRNTVEDIVESEIDERLGSAVDGYLDGMDWGSMFHDYIDLDQAIEDFFRFGYDGKDLVREQVVDYMEAEYDMDELEQEILDKIKQSLADDRVAALEAKVESLTACIDALEEARERSLSRRTATLFRSAADRTKFTLTAPKRWLSSARAALKARL